MIKNYFKIAWRNLMKNRTFSFINIFGLCAGLVCIMLISLYILNETSYDKYQKNADSIYQLGTEFTGLGNFKKLPNTPAAMGEMMKDVFPEIKQTTRLGALYSEDKTLLQYNKNGNAAKSFYESKGYLADSTFFRMFTYDFIEGNPATALDDPNTIVLNQEIAKKLFGNTPALNKVIHVSSSSNGDHDFLITGVFKPIDKPSHIDGRFFMSMQGGDMADMIKRQAGNLATNNMFFTYLQLKQGASAKQLQSKFQSFLEKYAGKDLKAVGFNKKQFLVPLTKIHLDEDVKNNVTPGGSKTYLYILGSIALLTLLIACINFMNLATAQSSKRSSEVGIRKVLGAERKWLVTQFLGESVLVSVLAFVLAFIGTRLLLPLFNSVADKNLTLTFSNHSLFIGVFILVSIITGLIAGSYPAVYLSGFNPATVLKGKVKGSVGEVWVRKGLVAFQFTLSIVLIVSVVVIYKQIEFVQSTNLGYDKDNVIYFDVEGSVKGNTETFLSEVAKIPGIKNVASSTSDMTGHSWSVGLNWEGKANDDQLRAELMSVNTDFQETLGLEMKEGRFFSRSFGNDSMNVVINEAAAKVMGFENPIGQHIKGIGSLEIIGVVKDFHLESFHEQVKPQLFLLHRQNFAPASLIMARIEAGKEKETLERLEAFYKTYNPGFPLDYTFLDDDYQALYASEQRVSILSKYFAGLAIVISALGLFGLAAFTAQRRIKEIGIRKILGSSDLGIVRILSADFTKTVFVAIIIALPVSYFVAQHWLADFAYRITLEWWFFAGSGCLAMVIALLTVSLQTVRAARVNPTECLKQE